MHKMLESMHELDERFEWLGRFYEAKDGSAVEKVSLVIATDLLELMDVAVTKFS